MSLQKNREIRWEGHGKEIWSGETKTKTDTEFLEHSQHSRKTRQFTDQTKLKITDATVSIEKILETCV